MTTPRADCPTPNKMRFATRSAAKSAASYRSRSVGFPLYTYKCACKSWHMTRQRQEITETAEAQLHGIGHALGMTDGQFMNVVIRDITNELDPAEGEILRHPDVLDRWRESLIMVRRRAESEVASIRKLRAPSAEDDEWRTLLLEHIEIIGSRQRECATVRARDARPTHVLSSELTPTYITEERVREREYAREQPSKARLARRTAGDRTLEILVNRHREEFSEIFNTEAERAGVTLRYSHNGHAPTDEEIARLRDMDPPGVTPADRQPRLPDAHLAITGEETFDEVAALLIGTVYRHLRDVEGGVVAARAVRDIALQIERHRIEHRNIRSIAYVAHDWVSLHI